MSGKPEECVPVGIDLGFLHARVAIGNVSHAQRSSASSEGPTPSASADALIIEDVRIPLPEVVSNASGSRYTLALVGTDQQPDCGEDGGDNKSGGHVFGDAARRALARDKKPTVSKDPSSLVRQLTNNAEGGAAASAFFEHLAEMACDASSSKAACLRAVVSVPVGATAEEQAAVVRIAEQGFEVAGGADGKKMKKMNVKNGDASKDDGFIVGVITDPAAVCIAHGLAEVPRVGVVDLSASPTDPNANWKNALVVDWGASGLTATRIVRAATQSSIFTIAGHVSDPTCSGVAIVDALMAHCASMFERKNRLKAGEMLSSSVKARHRLEVACESAVRTLCRAPTTTVAIDGLYEGMDLSVSVSRPRFDMLTGPILKKAETLLQKVAQDAQEAGFTFDVVLLAGNVCDMPSATALVQTKVFSSVRSFGRADVPPDEAVAIGCARHAASVLSCPTHSRAVSKATGPAVRSVAACPISVGICKLPGKTRDVAEEEAIITKDAVPLIDVGEPLPANVTRKIIFGEEGFSDCTLAIAQIGANGVKSKILGTIDRIQPGATSLEITLELTATGQLTLSVNGGPNCKL